MGKALTTNLREMRAAHTRPTGKQLIDAVRQGDVEMVRNLLAQGVNANYVVDEEDLTDDEDRTDDEGRTGLMLAAERGHAEIVNAIITRAALSQRNNGADWMMMTMS